MKLTLINNLKKSLGTRYVKYGGFAAIVTVAAIVAVIFLNLIFQQFSPQFDLTEEKLFSLSGETLQILQAVKKPVTIYGIWEPGRENIQAREVAELYAARSPLVRFEAVDPDLNPGRLRRFTQNDQSVSKRSLVVEGEKGFRIISEFDMYDIYYDQQQQQSRISGQAIEKKITSALMYVSTGETPVVYEITGHGETALYERQMREPVERENYALKELNLFQSPIPDDASALILNNPLQELTQPEAEKLLAYLEGGGRLLALLDYESGAVESLNGVLASYGIRFDFGVVVEQDPGYLVSRVPFELVPDAASHDIVRPLTEKNTPPILDYAMGISTLDMKRRTVNIVPILTSSPSSFLRTNLESDAPDRRPEDLPGPLNLAVAVMDPEYPETGKPQARIVAIASAVLDPVIAYMQRQQAPGNLDLFMNSLTWLEERPESLTVRSRSLFRLNMRISFLEALVIGIIIVIIIPLAFFILGLVTWLRRRHL